ncbi:MAG: sigma-70 family RNA polymerase sigma factor [Pirellulales bacterium]
MTDWSQIVEDHGPIVWKTAYRLLGNGADAADCFQRTFLAAVELSRRQPVRHWPALLRRLATARALEQLRVRIRERGRQTGLSESDSQDGRASPLEVAQASELAEGMRIALGEVDPRQAQAFCLTQLEGHSYDEVAAELGVTVNHVGVLLNRARATLKERLAAFAPHRVNETKQEVQP